MNPPAGWHPDPFDPAIDRYWDGTQWTGRTRPKVTDPATQVLNMPGFAPATGAAGATGDDPSTQALRSGDEFGAPSERPGKKNPKWPWIVGGVLVAFIGLGTVGAATDDDAANSESSTTRTSRAPSTTTTKQTSTAAIAPPVASSAEAPTSAYTPPPATATTAPAPTTTLSVEYSCSDALWRESMGAEGDRLCDAPWNPSPPAPAYTPPTAPAYTPPPAAELEPAPAPSLGTVTPGAFCSTPGAVGVTTKGTPMVCGVGSDGRDRWKSAG